jgi:type IV secretory pathway VirB2 component (pilin)
MILVRPQKKLKKGWRKLLIFVFGVSIIVTRSQLQEVYSSVGVDVGRISTQINL